MVILKLVNLAGGVKYKAYRTHFNLKMNWYIHRLLQKNLKVITSQKSIIDADTKKKGIQRTLKISSKQEKREREERNKGEQTLAKTTKKMIINTYLLII